MGCTWEVLSPISFETKRGESCRTSSSCRALAGRTAATTTGEANYAADRTLQLCQAFAWWFHFGKVGDKHAKYPPVFLQFLGIYNSSITLESLSQPIYFQPEIFEAISTAIPTAHMFLWNGLQVLPPWVVHWKRRPFVAICGAFNGWWTGAMQMRYWLQPLQPLLLDRPSREGLGKVMAVLLMFWVDAGGVCNVMVGWGKCSSREHRLSKLTDVIWPY